MVLSPLSSDSSSFSPVAGCFSLGLLSVNIDNTKRYCEMYMYKYRSVPQIRPPPLPPFSNLGLSTKRRRGLYVGCNNFSCDYALPSDKA